MHSLRFRQVHLDFHTSPAIEDVGAGFDRDAWQAALRRGHVNSITCFAVCHHGWNYNDTAVGARHPHLAFDLLRAQFDASKEIDVNVPVYISAGLNDRLACAHPEWREVDADGRYSGWASGITAAGFQKLCLNTPYLDSLCEIIQETVQQYPKADGIFLDIVSQGPCCCRWCLAAMAEHGLDARREEDRHACASLTLENYYRRATAAVRDEQPEMPVFHNSGHIARGRRDVLKHFSHLELESLPTGGWGYDHFVLSAKYCKNLDLDFLGMTGKFHTTWGEFGGYKHPNALRYECAAMLAWGAKCSVGDQLHPSGRMDESTYEIVGAAYAEVESKEPWCEATRSVADVAVLSGAAVRPGAERECGADTGATRILLEGHFLFDVIDAQMPFEPYRVLILPDEIAVGDELEAKLKAFLRGGGRLFLTGRSGLRSDGAGFAFDIGAEHDGPSPFQPDYVVPCESLRPAFVRSPLAMYTPSQRIRVTDGESLGAVHDPYFNRDYRHFCSHQHAPARPEPSGYDAGVLKGPILYLAHPVFSQYAATGAVALKDYVARALRRLLGADETLQTNLPSTARVSLMEQPERNRYVLHLLYAGTISRGSNAKLSPEGYVWDTRTVEVIEDLIPLRDTEIALRLPRRVRKVTLEPQGKALAFNTESDAIKLVVAEFACHQMVALQYEPPKAGRRAPEAGRARGPRGRRRGA